MSRRMRDTPEIVGRTGAMWDEKRNKRQRKGNFFEIKKGEMEAQVIDGGVGGDAGCRVLMWSLRQGRVN